MTRPVYWKPWTLSCWQMTSWKQLPKSNIQQDENTQEQVLNPLQHFAEKHEYLNDIKPAPYQTSRSWYQENHSLTGEPQKQEAIFTAGVQNAEGVCHVLKITLSPIHTGGGNWSKASVDGFYRENRILCDRL
ncbi:hypothetical protein [Desulfosediminicola sp.]|uniref:hypothetical protein n=1 Tax=Desulfosediminicola sp. TaxID=2886825 RepID=UPI003AF21B19